MSTVNWETPQASFPTARVDPQVGIFLSPLNTNHGFYYLTARGKDKKQTAACRPHINP